MNEIIRKVFVEMYKREDLLEKFKKDVIKLAGLRKSTQSNTGNVRKGNLDLMK